MVILVGRRCQPLCATLQGIRTLTAMIVGGMISWLQHSLSCRRAKHNERHHQLSERLVFVCNLMESFTEPFNDLCQYFGPGTDDLHYVYLMHSCAA